MFKKLFLSERLILTLIVCNAFIIFLLSFPKLSQQNYIIGVDHIFVIFFLIEIFVKIKTWGIRGYFQNPWNKFDFIVILASTPALLQSFAGWPDTSAFLLLRLFRLFRIVRILEFIPHVRQLMLGLARAFKASFLVLFALITYDFILAILTCQLYGKIAPAYFGDPLLSAYTIFQLFTLEGWTEIVEATIASSNLVMSNLIKLYFIFIVLSGGIFGISLANAIFVDEMTIDNNLPLEEKLDRLHDKINALQKLLEEKNEKVEKKE